LRNPSQSPQLAEISAREKLSLSVVSIDVDSEDSVRNTIANIQKDGPIDVLVNNAGIERAGSVEELPLAEFRAVMETNYFGALRCIQAVVPQMRERCSGCIINVTSVGGRIASPPLTPYNASKWALEALSEGLAGEMKAFGVRVNIIEPGIIDTAMAQRIGVAGKKSLYPHRERMAVTFSESLKNPVTPAVVAQKILEVATNGTWQLRHPVGPDALPLLQWRAGFTDEQWVELQGVDDETWRRSRGLASAEK
jgi:NAD(P)-dependent dehydrogenase (short-subunit alcohol dehydrogenase family)